MWRGQIAVNSSIGLSVFVTSAMHDLKLNELVFSIVASNFEPNLLQPQALKISNIIPQSWELAQNPIVNASGSQVVYQNGIQVVSQLGRCLFAEPLEKAPDSKLETTEVVKRFVSNLPNLTYDAIGINIRGYIPFNGDEHLPQNYIEEQLLKVGDWCETGASRTFSELKQTYLFDDHRLLLTINAATLKRPEQSALPILLFGGTFEYTLTKEQTELKHKQIHQIIDDSSNNLQFFLDLIGKFPTSTVTQEAIAA